VSSGRDMVVYAKGWFEAEAKWHRISVGGYLKNRAEKEHTKRIDLKA